MTPRIVIDRFEGDLAVLECGGSTWNVPRAVLPPDASEGDVLGLVIDPDATRAARDDAAARLARLKARTPQGPGTFDL